MENKFHVKIKKADGTYMNAYFKEKEDAVNFENYYKRKYKNGNLPK